MNSCTSTVHVVKGVSNGTAKSGTLWAQRCECGAIDTSQVKPKLYRYELEPTRA